jgi:integrase
VLGPVHGGFARLLLLTLARREEVARMTWDELAADLSTWTLPPARSKNGRGHVVHLAEPARSILRALPLVGEANLVFATKAGKGLTTFSHIARMLTRHAMVDGWRLHDFRRTGVTALAGMGFSPAVCDRLLNHVQGTIRGVAAIYQRHEFLKEREAALHAWTAHVLQCAGAAPGADNRVTSRSSPPEPIQSSGSADRFLDPSGGERTS